MDRKKLEALVGDVRTKWYRGELGDVPLDVAITDALWEKMVPTRVGFTDGAADMQFGNRCMGDHCRVLFVTYTPAPMVEEDAVKLAQWVDKYVFVTPPCPYNVQDAVKRILKEAPDAD